MSRTPAFAAAGFLALLACLLPPFAQAREGTVIVNAPGSDDRSVTVRLQTLGAPDINNQEYQFESGRKTISGYSISRVLRAAEVGAPDWLDLETLPSVEIDRPTGGPVILSRAQFLAPSERPPVFYENGGTTVFVMPGSPGREYVFRSTPIGIQAGSESFFDVTLTASPKRPKQGEAVRITATVEGVSSETTLSYRWSFSDGAVKTTATGTVTHRFSTRGRRSVVVTVTGSGVEGQEALVLDVTGAPDGGGGSSVPPPDGNGVAGGDSGGSYGSGGYGDTPYGAIGGGDGSVAGSGAAPTPRAEERPENPRQAPGEGLEEVSGILIDPAATVSPSASAGPGAEGEPSRGAGLGIPGEAATLFGVGLLIALGGLIEARLLFRRT